MKIKLIYSIVLCIVFGSIISCNQESKDYSKVDLIPKFDNVSGYYGYATADGQFAIEPKYHQAYPFYKGRATVYDTTLIGGEKNGIIDKNGNEIVPLSYDHIDAMFINNYCGFKQNGLWGALDTLGNVVVPAMYDLLGDFTPAGITYFFSDADSAYGLINARGEVLLEPEFDLFYENTYAEAANDKPYIVVYKDGATGLINYETGEYTIPLSENQILSEYAQGMLFQFDYDNFYGYYVDEFGKKVIDQKYDDGYQFSEGLAWVEIDSKMAAIDTTGKIVIPSKYEYAYPFENGYAEVYKDEGYDTVVVIDKHGNEVYTGSGDDYIEIFTDKNEVYILINSDVSYCLNGKGKIVVPHEEMGKEWSAIYYFDNGVFRVEDQRGLPFHYYRNGRLIDSEE